MKTLTTKPAPTDLDLQQLSALILYDTAEPLTHCSRHFFGAVGAAGAYVFFPLGQDFGRKLAETCSLNAENTDGFSWFFGFTSIIPALLLGYMSVSKHGVLLSQKIFSSTHTRTLAIEDYFQPLNQITSGSATFLILFWTFIRQEQELHST